MRMNRIVALGDILGFSQTVLKAESVDDVVNGPLTFLRNSVHHSLHRAGWPKAPPSLPELKANPLVGFAWFSDTIVFYGREDSSEAANAVVETVAWLLFETIHTRTANVRVGIDYGELHVDEANDVYVGPSLVGAYRLEQAQRWVGGAITPAAAEQISVDVLDEYSVPYSVPLKEGARVTSDRAIRWHFAPHFDLPLDPVTRLRGHIFETAEEKAKAEIKWQNTDQFHRTTCEICRANCRPV
jgi:hypothetical protein